MKHAESAERDALAAAAMAFAPATEVPRDRAVMRSALTSLVQDFSGGEFSSGDALQSIRRHGELVELREDYAREIFGKLLAQKAIVPGLAAERFLVAESVRVQLRETSDELARLLQKVVERLFSTHSASQQQAMESALLKCLAKLMSEFGRQYAHQVAGRTDGAFSPNRKELLRICQSVVTKKADAEHIADAIVQLYGGNDPAFARFAFSLTQNYYYLSLLGLTGGLGFFSQERFKGAEMFIDTNLLFAFLLVESNHHRSILELSELALRLKISLHVTELTLDEFKAVVMHYQTQLAKTFDEVPDALVASVARAPIFQAYRARKRKAPAMTIESFFESLEDPRGLLSEHWGVSVLDHHFDSAEDKRFAAKAKDELQRASQYYRTKTKTERALVHDAHLLQMVRSERAEFGDRSAWVLTLDTSFIPACKELQSATDPGYSMMLDGFLQVLSPYVRADQQQNFAENFLRVFSRGLFAPDDVLELEDFRMFTDIDLSVRRLEPKDVRKVIHKVRDAVGGDLGNADRKQIAYQVQKALSDPTLTYKTTLETKIGELEGELESEISSRQFAEDQVRRSGDELQVAQRAHERETAALRAEMDSHKSRMEERLLGLEKASAEKENELRLVRAEQEGNRLREKSHSDKTKLRRTRFWAVLINSLLIVALWLIPSSLVSFVDPEWAFRAGGTAACLLMAIGVCLRWTVPVSLGLALGLGGAVAALAALAPKASQPAAGSSDLPHDASPPEPDAASLRDADRGASDARVRD